MVTVGDILRSVRNKLKEANVENYSFDARCITEHVLNMDRSQLILNSGASVANSDEQLINELTEKRISGYPLQYLTGRWEFFGLPFFVGEGVLIPRQDTELIVECALNEAAQFSKPVIADLCSGSGCIAVALDHELNNADIYAAELSDIALTYLKKNTELNRSSVRIMHGDVLEPSFAALFPQCDIIVSNPPYLTDNDMQSLQKEVSFEPEMALSGGSDGLFFYRNITKLWKNKLVRNGVILFETGIGQETDVANILSDNGFTEINTYRDLSGIFRVVSGRKSD